MIITVDKATIIDALRKEQLTAQTWISPVHRGRLLEGYSISEPCVVCAVGAVLRNVLAPDETVFKLRHAAAAATDGGPISHAKADDEEGLPDLLEHGQYMNALSCFFETTYDQTYRELGDNYTEEFVRAACIKFVDESFPDEVMIDIDDARPSARFSKRRT